MNKLLAIIYITGIFATCDRRPDLKQVTDNTTPNTPLTYLALGDSYTIGEAVPLERSFPYQLAVELNHSGHTTSNPHIIAVTGWTTDELISAINDSGTQAKKYNIVTLLIGVNNQYRGYPQDTYRTEFIHLLNTAVKYAGGNPKHVFVLSIPNYGVTPYAEGSDRQKIGAEIAQFNAINKQETQKKGAAYLDITPASEKAAADPTLTAADGLHPSAKMYALWVQQLAPAVREAFR